MLNYILCESLFRIIDESYEIKFFLGRGTAKYFISLFITVFKGILSISEHTYFNWDLLSILFCYIIRSYNTFIHSNVAPTLLT